MCLVTLNNNLQSFAGCKIKGGNNMFKKFGVLVLTITFMSLASFALAEDVFVTAKGSKFHKEDCRLIKNHEDVTTMDRVEALENDYEPCKRCFKETSSTDDATSEKAETKKVETKKKDKKVKSEE